MHIKCDSSSPKIAWATPNPIYSLSNFKEIYNSPFSNRNYLDSGWCKEEFQLAHLEAVEGRHRFIILIMLEDIDVKDLPDEMQKYVKTYTYIDGTKLDNDKEVDLFKKKLLYIMPKTPIREFNIERNEDYNYNVPPLFNRMFKYRDHMTRFDRP